LFCISIFAQVFVDDVDINKLDIEYCEIIGQRKFLSTKVKVTVDYEQKRGDMRARKSIELKVSLMSF